MWLDIFDLVHLSRMASQPPTTHALLCGTDQYQQFARHLQATISPGTQHNDNKSHYSRSTKTIMDRLVQIAINENVITRRSDITQHNSTAVRWLICLSMIPCCRGVARHDTVQFQSKLINRYQCTKSNRFIHYHQYFNDWQNKMGILAWKWDILTC